MHYTEIFFSALKIEFHWKFFDIFLIFAQNIEYLLSMFWSKNKKNMYIPANGAGIYLFFTFHSMKYPSFTIQYNDKVGFEWLCIARTCFPDAPLVRTMQNFIK